MAHGRLEQIAELLLALNKRPDQGYTGAYMASPRVTPTATTRHAPVSVGPSVSGSSPDPHSPRGSLWSKWDLHLHTPSSFDYDDKSVTDEAIVERLVKEDVRLVAVTDHHTMDVSRIRHLRALAAGRITILPGMELRTDHGDKPIHYICIFPEDCALDHVWTTLQGKLELTAPAITARGGDDGVFVPIEQGAKATHDLKGVVSIHAGVKSNSIENISNAEAFQRRIKYEITRDSVDLLEIGQIKDIDSYHKIVFPNTGLEKPLVITSDCHDIKDYVLRGPQWFRADPTFRGLLMVMREPRDRVFIGDVPPDVLRVKQDPTKYVRSISFTRLSSAPAGQKWFSGSVDFSSGLVAIVGNKGSGKSALADTLGLLGGTKHSAAFSFLSEERFRRPNNKLASHFEASITWESGDVEKKSLAADIPPEEVERIKYLPQDHVERVCNELASIGPEMFEQELKAVIFSHVPEAERLGLATLDELVRYRTDEKQKRIDSLLKRLRQVSRSRAVLEGQAHPTVRQELLERIKRKEDELAAQDKTKPAAVADPAAGGGAAQADAATLKQLKEAEAEKLVVAGKAMEAEGSLSAAERRAAVASRLLEKLDNFKKEFDAFLPTLTEDATFLGLDVSALISLSVDRNPVTKESRTASRAIFDLKEQLSAKTPPGLRAQLTAVDQRIAALHLHLDAPNRAYQAYLVALAEWQARRTALEGTAAQPDSLIGLRAALMALDGLPAQIVTACDQQRDLALEIHAEKLAQAGGYRTLYAAVQSFIDAHPIAKDKLALEFRVELIPEDFESRLLGLLALNRRGSFMGTDEGRARATGIVKQTVWDDAASIKVFLQEVDEALHRDLREKRKPCVQLADQLLTKRKAEEVFDLLYGLEYVRPRYVLRWEGKELSMLSPGERGTLLLVFYLLVDKSDAPLVIDQPEGNLDNHTVAKVLLECIKAARQRRQVFIVTHNPNLAVVCDADQIIHASIDKADGNAITYTAGSLENPAMAQYITDVLEGTRWAFDRRGAKYDVSTEA
jgi:predicted ATP-dependent endonuclease of OLD family